MPDILSLDSFPRPGSMLRKAVTRGIVAAGLAGLLALPVQASVNIPEGGAVPPGSIFVIHFQVREGCDDAATDGLEVTLPENVENPVPESVAGWQAEVETLPGDEVDDEDDARTVVRWTGGPLQADSFIEFGLRARFPDEPDARLTFPAVQTCGVLEREWTGDEAPTLVLAPRLGPRDVIDLGQTVDQLSGDVEDLGTRLDEVDTRLSGVDPANLRARVREVEEAVEELSRAVEELQRPADVGAEADDA